jgi:hypothetical protein
MPESMCPRRTSRASIKSLEHLRKISKENPRLEEMLTVEVARQPALGGHLERKGASPLVGEALEGLEDGSKVSECRELVRGG